VPLTGAIKAKKNLWNPWRRNLTFLRKKRKGCTGGFPVREQKAKKAAGLTAKLVSLVAVKRGRKEGSLAAVPPKPSARVTSGLMRGMRI
jgi:hypothetical protein